MGAGASVSMEEVNRMPQYTILGGDSKFNELKDEEGKVALDKFQDPYLKYGGAYYTDAEDTKNTADFKYVRFDTLPTFTPQHRSGMAKHLTAEVNK